MKGDTDEHLLRHTLLEVTMKAQYNEEAVHLMDEGQTLCGLRLPAKVRSYRFWYSSEEACEACLRADSERRVGGDRNENDK